MIISISMATETADDHLVDERQVAQVGLDQLQHADVGRHPRQRAEADQQQDSLDVRALPLLGAPAGGVTFGKFGGRAQAQLQRVQ